MIRSLITCCAIYLAVACPASAADYYLSQKGHDDKGDGSRKRPWASLGKLNQQRLRPGDRVYLKGGDTFEGTLIIASDDGGTPKKPVQITGYGKKPAIIIPGPDEDGIFIYNTAGIEIRNLIIDGKDLSKHHKRGIHAFIDLPNNQRAEHLVITDCEIRNVREGIIIGAAATDKTHSGFKDVLIERLHIHNCEHEGFTSYGMLPTSATQQSHRNITLRDCEVSGITGDPNLKKSHSGSGIILSGTLGGLIERCYSHHNGGGGGRPNGGGPVAIWTYEAAEVIIRECLAHNQKTVAGAKDGGGFDLDGGAVNCVIEHCYSYDNEGPGYLVAEYPKAAPIRNNVVRYNVSYNDSHANKMGLIHFWNAHKDPSKTENIDFYNNLIVAGPETTGPVIAYQSGGIRDMRFFNNIFVTQRNLLLVKSSNTTGFSFQGNIWHSTSNTHSFRWGKKTYSSLEEWRNAPEKPERHNGIDVGLQADPELTNIENMPKPTSINELQKLTAFLLRSSSPAIDGGLNLHKEFSIDPGKRDFFNSKSREDQHTISGRTKPGKHLYVGPFTDPRRNITHQ